MRQRHTRQLRSQTSPGNGARNGERTGDGVVAWLVSTENRSRSSAARSGAAMVEQAIARLE